MRDLAAELRGTAARERRHGRNDVPQLCEDAADELAALRADRDELQCTVTRRDIAISGLENQVKSLRARVAELEADAERLNWLQANPRLSTIRLAGESDRECYMYAVAGAPGLKLREIIDAARLSGNKPPQCFSTEGDDRR